MPVDLTDLRDGVVPLDVVVEGQKAISSVLTEMMRVYYKKNIALPLDFGPIKLEGLPAFTPQRDSDHFLELQHVIDLILLKDSTIKSNADIVKIPLAEFLRLSQFLNHEYNLYDIAANLNNYKSRIPIELYIGPPANMTDKLAADQYKFIQSYLNSEVDTQETEKVQSVNIRVYNLILYMQDAKGPYSGLCNKAGKLLADWVFHNKAPANLASSSASKKQKTTNGNV